jgi:hypothetical protein
MPMSRSAHPSTRATRDAANAAASAVLVYAVLWVVSTQVKPIRAVSPFAEDPWDAIASFAAIILPFVAGATWIRSLRHREPSLAGATARRIRWGSTVSAAIVLVASAADAQAIAAVGFPPHAGSVAGLLAILVALATAASAIALVLTAVAARVAGQSREAATDDPSEPDIVDDMLDLLSEVARLVGLGAVARRVAAAIERFLDGSAWSPRRHAVGFGLVLALAGGAGFATWHAIREGPSPSWAAPAVFTILAGSGILAGYLGTLRPLRLLRPPRP